MRLIRRFWVWLLYWLSWRDQKWLAIVVEDEPPDPKNHCVYLIAEDDEIWQAAFKCPCGCQATIQLCCLPETKPSWSYVIHPDKSISLSPSIWRKNGCRCHFFLRRGAIQWCEDINLT